MQSVFILNLNSHHFAMKSLLQSLIEHTFKIYNSNCFSLLMVWILNWNHGIYQILYSGHITMIHKLFNTLVEHIGLNVVFKCINKMYGYCVLHYQSLFAITHISWWFRIMGLRKLFSFYYIYSRFNEIVIFA